MPNSALARFRPQWRDFRGEELLRWRSYTAIVIFLLPTVAWLTMAGAC
ncbi:hypothetical protein ACVWYH_007315 [Bradyrhizobium sp. GM24.11]